MHNKFAANKNSIKFLTDKDLKGVFDKFRLFHCIADYIEVMARSFCYRLTDRSTINDIKAGSEVYVVWRKSLLSFLEIESEELRIKRESILHAQLDFEEIFVEESSAVVLPREEKKRLVSNIEYLALMDKHDKNDKRISDYYKNLPTPSPSEQREADAYFRGLSCIDKIEVDDTRRLSEVIKPVKIVERMITVQKAPLVKTIDVSDLFIEKVNVKIQWEKNFKTMFTTAQAIGFIRLGDKVTEWPGTFECPFINYIKRSEPLIIRMFSRDSSVIENMASKTRIRAALYGSSNEDIEEVGLKKWIEKDLLAPKKKLFRILFRQGGNIDEWNMFKSNIKGMFIWESKDGLMDGYVYDSMGNVVLVAGPKGLLKSTIMFSY